MQIAQGKEEEGSMNASTIRQLWSLISQTSHEALAHLSDSDLVGQLMTQLQNKQTLSQQEMLLMRSYIGSRTLLIREIVQQA
ncbi:hypothetical protein cce_4897 [Crocosphaera subtropica ATCC 51142]|uniref:Uncharacterized protein n=3 Tax=Aphanothecaceae TaxID=1890450 RepID=B1X282_CROS5|nr:hypothetical protein cce_4897 [Crocosphaera subtropica ATCC 51142]EAZ90750.1 hypothetical protein CY0110_32420 [Crocosphaera chwakensis CCY0110]